MARGTQLGTLINMLRAEIRDDSSPALSQNFRPTLLQTLQRHQRRLWQDFDWPHMLVHRDVPVSAGARYQAMPSDMPFERIKGVEFRFSSQWFPVSYGITDAEYNVSDSDAGARLDPVRAWQIYEDGNIEVWPIPATNGAIGSDGVLRFWGIRSLKTLAADSDTADLDDDLLVLYAAAEILSARKQPDAQAKLDQANAHYRRLKAAQSKHDMVVMGGGLRRERHLSDGRVPIPYLNIVWKPSA